MSQGERPGRRRAWAAAPGAAAVGVVVARRQPENPLDWLFLAIGICLFLSTDGGDYAQLAYHLGHRPPLAPAGLVLAQVWGPSLALFGAAILLFPDGRLTAVDHPAGWFGAVQGPLIVVIIGLSLAFIARQALSWRHAAGERRQQLKWLASGAAASIVCLVLATAYSTDGVPRSVLAVLGSAAWLGVAALPVSVGVAILRYRLYEIDRIISRTLACAIVTGLLVGVYAGLVLLATLVFGSRGSAKVAVATLAAAALFSPLRRRVQHTVDRRFNRARYDAEAMVTEFAARLQDAVDPDVVRADLAGAAQAALEPAHVSVWTAR